MDLLGVQGAVHDDGCVAFVCSDDVDGLVFAEIPEGLGFRLGEDGLGWFGPVEGLVDPDVDVVC